MRVMCDDRLKFGTFGGNIKYCSLKLMLMIMVIIIMMMMMMIIIIMIIITLKKKIETKEQH